MLTCLSLNTYYRRATKTICSRIERRFDDAWMMPTNLDK